MRTAIRSLQTRRNSLRDSVQARVLPLTPSQETCCFGLQTTAEPSFGLEASKSRQHLVRHLHPRPDRARSGCSSLILISSRRPCSKTRYWLNRALPRWTFAMPETAHQLSNNYNGTTSYSPSPIGLGTTPYRWVMCWPITRTGAEW